MSNKPFPAFVLPNLVTRKVFDYLDFVTLVNLATCSKTSCKTVGSIINVRTSKNTQINVEIGEMSRTVEVVGPDQKKFKWVCLTPRHSDAADLIGFVTRKVDGVDVKVCIKDHTFYSVEMRYENELVHWVNCLMNTFQCKIGTLSFLAKWDTKFDVIMKAPVFFESKKLILKPFAISHQEMDFILKNYKTQHVECQCNPGREYKYSEPIVCPIIEFHRGQFLTMNNLVQMTNDCRKVIIGTTHFTSADINEWLKMWLRTKSTTLEMLEVKKPYGLSEDRTFLFTEVIEGIPWTQSLPDKPYATPEFKEARRSKSAWDVSRSDGLLATILLTEEENNAHFQFFVWYDTSPRVQ